MSSQQYQDVLNSVQTTESAVTSLNNAITATPKASEMQANLDALQTALANIESWANTNYEQEAQQELLNTFLGELKTLFTTYSAVVDVVEVEPGYGVNYGGSQFVMQLSATQGAITASKSYNILSLDSADLP